VKAVIGVMQLHCSVVLFFGVVVDAVQRFRKNPSNASDLTQPKMQPATLNLNATAWTLTESDAEGKIEAPCRCTSYSTWWKKPNKREPTCLFIDLGAADGETYKSFVGISSKWSFNYDTGRFNKNKCYAYLMEANPKFEADLEALRTDHVYPMVKQAAYMCDKKHQDFWLDAAGPSSWGSSLNFTHQSVVGKDGSHTRKSVDVELYNLMRLLQENALPEDHVTVKMDIEGAEYDILPCLADAPAAELIDTLYLEDHCPGRHWCPTTGMAGNSKTTFQNAISKLQKRGVKIPKGYWSPM